MTTEEAIKICYKALDDKKGHRIMVLDIHEISSIGDYFVISSGSSANQIMAMAEEVTEKLSRAGFECINHEGFSQTNNWILLDYGDFIVHIFKEEDRHFYDLERIWSDAVDVTAKIK